MFHVSVAHPTPVEDAKVQIIPAEPERPVVIGDRGVVLQNVRFVGQGAPGPDRVSPDLRGTHIAQDGRRARRERLEVSLAEAVASALDAAENEAESLWAQAQKDMADQGRVLSMKEKHPSWGVSSIVLATDFDPGFVRRVLSSALASHRKGVYDGSDKGERR